MADLLFDKDAFTFPEQVKLFPKFRYMGSKFRLLSWIHTILYRLEFETALDACSGSACVAYLLKAMGKRVTTNDFLNCSATIARAIVENSRVTLNESMIERLMAYDPRHRRFIENMFSGIFYTPEDLRFLDLVSWNLSKFDDPLVQAMTRAALIRSCAKRQPRGVFTVAGDPEHYKDGRRDLRLSLREHFIEQVAAFNRCVFDNGLEHRALRGDVFGVDPTGLDLVYIDPPYVPRSDDNCYMKRYHFLEGLASYWEGVEIVKESRVKKIKKPYTPFSYRRTAHDAFDRLFSHFSASSIVLSYSSNGFPGLEDLVSMMRRYKPSVSVHERNHRYHFGTHGAAKRNQVTEYLIVGTS